DGSPAVGPRAVPGAAASPCDERVDAVRRRPPPAHDGEPERGRLPRSGDRPLPADAPRTGVDGRRRDQQGAGGPRRHGRRLAHDASTACGAGLGAMTWRPARSPQTRTYILRLRVGSRVYGAYGPGGRQDAPVVRVQGIDATFTKRSYAPGEAAELRLATDARVLHLQVYAYQSPGRPSEQDVHTNGLAKTGPIRIDWSAHRDRPALLGVVRAGDWPSGLYFVRATASDGRVGYAPFIVRPRVLGTRRVAVVLATNTWAAYNFEDADGDGWGDSW